MRIVLKFFHKSERTLAKTEAAAFILTPMERNIPKWRKNKQEEEQRPAAGTVQVESNLPGTLNVIAQFLMQMYDKKMFDFEMKVKLMEHNIRNHGGMAPMDGKYQDYKMH